MGYVAARCPNCAGDLQLDEKMEKGYCAHCGTPIYFKDAVQKIKIVGPVEIAGFAKLDNLIKLIKKDLEFGMNRTPEFRNRLNRALELDPSNQYLYDLQSSEIWNARIMDGRLLEYKSNAQRIVIPDCVVSIERFSLRGCTRLKELVLPRTIVNIEEGAFFKEGELTISAYKNTFAARYALFSPAFLKIIDDDENNQEAITKIEKELKEIVDYKDKLVLEIKARYRNHITGRIIVPIVIFVLIIFPGIIIPANFLSDDGFMFYLLFLGAVVMFSFLGKGYVEVYRKLAVKNQVMKFKKQCNDLLSPMGIIDFRYLKNIWESSNVDLEYEAKHLENIKKQIFKIDKKLFFRNAYVHLSLLAYMFGERPKGLDEY